MSISGTTADLATVNNLSSVHVAEKDDVKSRIHMLESVMVITSFVRSIPLAYQKCLNRHGHVKEALEIYLKDIAQLLVQASVKVSDDLVKNPLARESIRELEYFVETRTQKELDTFVKIIHDKNKQCNIEPIQHHLTYLNRIQDLCLTSLFLQIMKLTFVSSDQDVNCMCHTRQTTFMDNRPQDWQDAKFLRHLCTDHAAVFNESFMKRVNLNNILDSCPDERELTLEWLEKVATIDVVEDTYPFDGTCTLLVQDLQKILEEDSKENNLTQKQRTQIKCILGRALRKCYDDFHSPLECPKMTLDLELRNAGLSEMASRVSQGIYD